MNTSTESIQLLDQQKVFLAYEDTGCGIRAVNRLSSVAKLMEVTFATSAWQFDRFVDSAHRQEAADELAAADVVAVAVRGDRDLPEDWKEWFAAILKQGGPDRLILAVLDSGPFARKIETYLRSLANFCGFDFITTLPAEKEPTLLGRWLGGYDSEPFGHRQSIFDPKENSHWGINE